MSSMRIGGLASGIDTDSIVKQLMQVEKMPLDKLEQDKTWMTWQRDAYREINSLLFDLDAAVFDMKLSSTYQSKTVSSSEDKAVTAIAGANAPNGSHTIEVHQVATAARNISNKGISEGSESKIDADKSLWSQKDVLGIDNIFSESETYTENKDIKVGENGGDTFKLDKGAIVSFGDKKEIIVTDSEGNNTEQYEIITGTGPIDEASIGAKQVYVNTDTGEMKFGEPLKEGSTIKGPEYTRNTISFSFTTYDENGQPIEDDPNNKDGDYDFVFDATTSLNQIMNEITRSDVGISAFYDSYTDKVSFQRTETGVLNQEKRLTDEEIGKLVDKEIEKLKEENVVLTDEDIAKIREEKVAEQYAKQAEIGMSGEFFKVLGMDSKNEVASQNAEFTLDGLKTQRTSNTFNISGVTYSVKAIGTSTVSVEDNTEASFEKIKEFVDKYNETIDKINEKLNEDRYRDFKPLTDDQRAEMSENEIELWEEKARSGLLKRDSILSSALSEMRSSFYSQIETGGTFKHLSEIGIETTSNYLDGGKLEINETKLKEALAKDSEGVYKLFSNDVEGSDRGIMNRLEDAIAGTMDRIEVRAGKSTQTTQQYTMGRRLDNIDDQIERFQDRLTQIEDRYWSQFTQMEMAIQQMNSQSTYLMQQFSF
ncbi:flagellar filament capping protein FliD [Oceanobacillus bengalensis]|uniref:Flagellar hook-associated protein 2 n=1 Tax=Oceanobacillus bengalensis TaxID=1435466 RepID=A0A494Z6J6_9BACI|nr:flagellar filament capping protein FliD [Oceanobacillus bengalensis]RKQ18181.1 flagellar hook protein FliD [Oceanobacillus bengalensis]